MAGTFVNWSPPAGSFSGFGGASAGPATVTVAPATVSVQAGSPQSFTATSSNGGTNFLWSDGGAGGSFSVQNAATTVYTAASSGAITITALQQGSSGTAVETATFPTPSTNLWAVYNSPTFRAPNGLSATVTMGGQADPNSGTLASKVVFTGGTGNIAMYDSGTGAAPTAVPSVFTVQLKWVPTVPGTPLTAAFSPGYFGASNPGLIAGQVAFTLPDDGAWHTIGKVYTPNANDIAVGHFAMDSISPHPSYVTTSGTNPLEQTYVIPAGTLYMFNFKAGPV